MSLWAQVDSTKFSSGLKINQLDSHLGPSGTSMTLSERVCGEGIVILSLVYVDTLVNTEPRSPVLFTYALAQISPLPSFFVFIYLMTCGRLIWCCSGRTRQLTFPEQPSMSCRLQWPPFTTLAYALIHILRYAESSTSFSTDDIIATAEGANVYVRSYSICRTSS